MKVTENIMSKHSALSTEHSQLTAFHLFQKQRKHRANLPWLRKAVARALPLCKAHAKGDEPPLLSLTEIEASIVSDKVIGQVHADFLGDPTPTDVITFHHGEILVSADTAAREGPNHGLTFDEELLLYLIHGLMHLGGWDDHEPEEAAEMKRLQEGVWGRVKRDE
jgi:probable rRNA maturation factor